MTVKGRRNEQGERERKKKEGKREKTVCVGEKQRCAESKTVTRPHNV